MSNVSEHTRFRGARAHALVSIEAISNTKSAYKRLSRVLSEARKLGRFPWHLMQDKTRGIVNRQSEDSLETILGWASTRARGKRLYNYERKVSQKSFMP